MNAPVRVPVRATCLLAAMLLAAVPGATLAQEAAASDTQAMTAAGEPTSDRVINMILVKVNGAPIFLSDLQEHLDDQLALLRAQFSEAEIQAQLPQLRANVLTGLIDNRMMMQRADQMGITADANAVDRAIQRLREQNNLLDDNDFQAALQTMNMSLDDLREQMRSQIRQQQLVFQEVQRSLVVSDTEISRYYDAHADEFSAPEQVRIEQLVFVGGAGLQERAQSALDELRGGASFDDVASRYPDASAFPADETFVAVQDLQESLAAAVPDLPVGTYSDLIQSQFGWHIVRVVERQEHTVRALEDVKDAIRQRLTAEKSQKRLGDYLAQLREQTHLTILAPEFNNIEEAWRSRGDETSDTE